MVGRKLTAEEVAQAEKPKAGSSRLAKLAQYDTLVEDFSAGEWGELTLDENEKVLTVKKNVKLALERRNLDVQFGRSKGNLLRFQVIEPNPAYGDGH